MTCPQCGALTRVLDTRAAGGQVRRTRRCVAGHPIHTTECVAPKGKLQRTGPRARPDRSSVSVPAHVIARIDAEARRRGLTRYAMLDLILADREPTL